MSEYKKYFGVYDKQLGMVKYVNEDKTELLKAYAESLYEQALDGNGEEEKENIDKLSDQELFDMFGYEVIELDKKEYESELLNDWN